MKMYKVTKLYSCVWTNKNGACGVNLAHALMLVLIQDVLKLFRASLIHPIVLKLDQKLKKDNII